MVNFKVLNIRILKNFTNYGLVKAYLIRVRLRQIKV